MVIKIAQDSGLGKIFAVYRYQTDSVRFKAVIQVNTYRNALKL